MWTEALDQALRSEKTNTHKHTQSLATGAGYCDLCVSMCFLLPTCAFVFVCISSGGPRLMRYERVLPSSVVFLRVTVKVDLGTRERVHGWRRQGHVSPTCPIWFRGLCSTLHLLFLPNLCTWGEVKSERKLSLHYTILKKSLCALHTNIVPRRIYTHCP